MQDVIKELIALNIGRVLINEKISKYTTYKVGGIVRAIVYPKSQDDLIKLIKFLKVKNIKYFLLGNGSNVLFSDKLYDGIIIKLDCFNNISFNDDYVIAGAGVKLVTLSREAIKKSLAGLEFADGIPGTVGGALFMNAGAYGEDMSSIVVSATIVDSEGNVKILTNKELNFSYRTSSLQKKLSDVCISVELKLKNSDKNTLSEMVKKRREIRIATQPLSYPSAGSVFRNPPSMYAGKLIEDMGLKGFSVGDASISTKHANFIINKGHAKAKDIKDIIDFVKKRAIDNYGIKLRVEQRLINWDD